MVFFSSFPFPASEVEGTPAGKARNSVAQAVGPAERSETSLQGRCPVTLDNGVVREVLDLALAGGIRILDSTGAESDNDVVAGGGFGLDVIRQVVGVGACEGPAARDGVLGIDRVHLVDALLVIGVDNGRHVKVRGIGVRVPSKLGQHARRAQVLAGRHRVAIASPAVGELNGDVLTGGDISVVDGRVASPDNGAVGAVHGRKGNIIGGTG